MKALRTFFLSLLVAAVAMTSHSQVMARAVHGETTTVVICAGGQIGTITLDVDGNPVDAPPICPDCVLHVATMPPMGVSMAHPMSWRSFTPVFFGIDASSVKGPSPSARGPPVDL